MSRLLYTSVQHLSRANISVLLPHGRNQQVQRIFPRRMQLISTELTLGLLDSAALVYVVPSTFPQSLGSG